MPKSAGLFCVIYTAVSSYTVMLLSTLHFLFISLVFYCVLLLVFGG